MFTGIIRHTGTVDAVRSKGEGKEFTVSAPPEIMQKLEIGITSVALSGSCHTVTALGATHFTVYSSYETLSRTKLGNIKRGDRINLELPLTPTSLLDGHIVQGHVDALGEFLSMKKRGDASQLRFSVPRDLSRYLVEKDSIAIDGVSLTLFNIDGETFEVAMIPETALKTTLGSLSGGDKVNIEVNILAKYGFKFYEERDKKAAVWQDFLK